MLLTFQRLRWSNGHLLLLNHHCCWHRCLIIHHCCRGNLVRWCRARRHLLRVWVRHNLRLLVLLQFYWREVDAFDIVGLSGLDLGAVENLHLCSNRFAYHDILTRVVACRRCLGQLVRPSLVCHPLRPCRARLLLDDYLVMGCRRATAPLLWFLITCHVHQAILSDLSGRSLLELLILVNLRRIDQDGLGWVSRVSCLLNHHLFHILLMVNQLHIFWLNTSSIWEMCHNLTAMRSLLVLWKVVFLVAHLTELRWIDRLGNYGLLQR